MPLSLERRWSGTVAAIFDLGFLIILNLYSAITNQNPYSLSFTLSLKKKKVVLEKEALYWTLWVLLSSNYDNET